jgi:hypothetical protein
MTNAKPIATSSGEEVSAHMLFSVAFLQLVKLWKFHRPPLEHCLLGSGAGLGADLSLEYLLQLRNLQLASPPPSDKYGLDQVQQSKQRLQVLGTGYSPPSPPKANLVSLDFFPRLRVWYMQHQACISSTISGLGRNNPAHNVADRLLAMMFKKASRAGSATTSGVSGNTTDDISGKLILCAWDIIAAVPIVVEAALTACAHGTLGPPDLTKGNYVELSGTCHEQG